MELKVFAALTLVSLFLATVLLGRSVSGGMRQGGWEGRQGGWEGRQGGWEVVQKCGREGREGGRMKGGWEREEGMKCSFGCSTCSRCLMLTLGASLWG